MRAKSRVRMSVSQQEKCVNSDGKGLHDAGQSQAAKKHNEEEDKRQCNGVEEVGPGPQ